MKINDKLMQLRVKSGYTKEQVAKFLGVEEDVVSAMEATGANVSVGVLMKFSELYLCPLEDLMNETVMPAVQKVPFTSREATENDFYQILKINKVILNLREMIELKGNTSYKAPEEGKEFYQKLETVDLEALTTDPYVTIVFLAVDKVPPLVHDERGHKIVILNSKKYKLEETDKTKNDTTDDVDDDFKVFGEYLVLAHGLYIKGRITKGKYHEYLLDGFRTDLVFGQQKRG